MNKFFAFFILILLSCQEKSITVDPDLKAHRDNYKEGFLHQDRSPLTKEDLEYLDFFGSNPDFKVEATFEEDLSPVPFKMPTYSGKQKEFVRYGTFYFKVQNKRHSLEVYRNLRVVSMPQYRNVLFLPFKDETNDVTTYGGGRYLDLKTDDIVDNKMVLDFNHAYNPWCAYSDGFNCPIPPRANHLELEVLAGEKKFKGNYKKQ